MQNYFSGKLTAQQIAKVPFFTGLPSNVLNDFVSVLKVTNFKQGDYVFSEGDEAKEMYFIIQGSVKILKKTYKGSTKLLAELNEAQFFGEMALIDKGRRSTSVIASSDLVLASLSWNKLDETFESYKPDLAIYTYKRIAQALSLRLRQANTMNAHSL